jgi:hypothetical protein
LAIAFTIQLTPVLEVLETLARNDFRWPTLTVAEDGVTLTLMLLETVTMADAVKPPPVACIVTGFDGGGFAGAV